MPGNLKAPSRGDARRDVIHAGQGVLWAGAVCLALGTLCAAFALQDIRWLAGTFAFMVLALIALWAWMATCIILDPQGLVIGRMFGIDAKLAYKDMARVHFIRVETGNADLDWQLRHRLEALDVRFETARAQGRARPPYLVLRIEPKSAAAKREVRLDLEALARPNDIQLLYDRLPKPVAAAAMPIW